MPGRGTPRHAVRIPDDLWQAAIAAAERQGTTLTEVVRAALERYVREHGGDNQSRS